MAASPVLKEGFLLKRDGKLISDFIKFHFTKENAKIGRFKFICLLEC